MPQDMVYMLMGNINEISCGAELFFFDGMVILYSILKVFSKEIHFQVILPAKAKHLISVHLIYGLPEAVPFHRQMEK